jgi:hypothetical protein
LNLKPHANNPLEDLLRTLHSQNETLGKARNEYLSLEASRKFEEAALIKAAEGKSHSEKITNAQGTKAWLNFHKKLARAEAIYEFQRLKFSILEKEFQAVYLMHKLDSGLIKKEF